MMKTILIPTVVMLFLFCGLSSSYGNTYFITYEVVAISDNSLMLVGNDGVQREVNKDPKDYKVGYKVRYDSIRDILRKARWQDYAVIKVSSNSITLKHKNGDILKLDSGDLKGHINKFKKGDTVSYDTVDGHLKLAK